MATGGQSDSHHAISEICTFTPKFFSNCIFTLFFDIPKVLVNSLTAHKFKTFHFPQEFLEISSFRPSSDSLQNLHFCPDSLIARFRPQTFANLLILPSIAYLDIFTSLTCFDIVPRLSFIFLDITRRPKTLLNTILTP